MLPHIKGLIGKADTIDNVMSNIVCMVEERKGGAGDEGREGTKEARPQTKHEVKPIIHVLVVGE